MKLKPLVFLYILCISIVGTAQTNSPFSIGSAGFSVPSNPINSIGIGNNLPAFYQKEYINTSNPATYSSFYQSERTSFLKRTLKDTVEIIDGQRKLVTKVDSVTSDTVLFTYKVTSFQAGVLTEYERFTQDGSSFATGSANPQYFTLGLPIPKIGGMVFGLQQNLKQNYELNTTQQLADTSVGSVTNLFNGKGALFSAFAGAAVKWRNTSFGAQLNYTFGTPTKTQITYYPEQKSTVGALYEQAQIVSGLNYTLGIHQQIKLAGNTKLMLGTSYRPYSNVSARNRTTSARVLVGSEDAYTVIDTVELATVSSSFDLPQQLNIGVSLQDFGFFDVHAGFQSEAWSATNHTFANESLDDAYAFNIGTRARFIKEGFTRNFIQNNFYSLGFQMGNSPLTLDGAQYAYTGVSFGIGIPIQQRFPKSPLLSVLDLGFSWKNYSNGLENSASLNQFQFNLGLNLNDNFWIFKQKYD